MGFGGLLYNLSVSVISSIQMQMHVLVTLYQTRINIFISPSRYLANERNLFSGTITTILSSLLTGVIVHRRWVMVNDPSLVGHYDWVSNLIPTRSPIQNSMLKNTKNRKKKSTNHITNQWRSNFLLVFGSICSSTITSRRSEHEYNCINFRNIMVLQLHVEQQRQLISSYTA